MNTRRITVVAGVAAIILIVLYMYGAFDSGRIGPGEKAKGTVREIEFDQTATADRIIVGQCSEAIGTIRPKTETRVEAQVTGRVRLVLVRPGQKVKKGQELITLDDREFKARLEQAEQGLKAAGSRKAQAQRAVASAKAQYDRTKSTYSRLKQLFDQKAVTSEELDQAKAAFLQAKAGLEQAKEGVDAATAQIARAEKMMEESNISLGYTVITAQDNGEVAKRTVEPGDLAFPGKELLLVQTGGSLRLEALVREGLIGQVRVGQVLPVLITALGETVNATVEEIVPAADPLTRSFVVKAGLPAVPGLYPGMFGRMLIPIGEAEIVVVPEKAITRVGQLDTVMVLDNGRFRRIYVTTGQRHDDKVEVLTGLEGNETVGIGG